MKTSFKSVFKKTFKYIFDFIVVFAGVFLAFYLSERKDEQKELQKKQEIYLAIYEDLNSFYESGRRENKDGFINFFEKIDHDSDSMIAVKQLPVLTTVYGDYWKIDIIKTLIESGYIKEIDIYTFKKVTRFNTVHQNFLRSIEIYNEFYDKYVTANHDKGMDFFYKPNSNELKPKYSYLNNAMKGIAEFSELLVGISKELSVEIKENHLKEDQ